MNQTISATHKSVLARVIIPGSKNMTYRALFIAALADGVTELNEVFICDNTVTFVNALRELGVMIQLDKSTRTCIIGGGGGRLPKSQGSLFFDNGKIPAIFLSAASATTEGVYEFDATESLRHETFASFLKALTRLGAKITPHQATSLPFSIEGEDGLSGGEVEIDADDVGIFTSALLMIGPFAKKSILIKTDDSLSQPFIEMTVEMMADFNVLARRMHRGRYSVPVPQRYLARDYIIEPDFSIAANFFAAAAVTGGQVTIQPIHRASSKQREIEFLKVLEKMGCSVIENETGLTVTGPLELKGVNVDMRYFSDTFMALAAIAPFAKTPTTMTNIGKERTKGIDRIALMHAELEKLGCKVEEGKDWLKIYPSGLKVASVDASHDPRIAMALSIIQLRVPNMQVHHAEDANKVCPDFFALWDKLLP